MSGRKLPRGVYEKVPGSKDYWIRYADHTGKIRRQYVGRSLAAAKELAEQRRTEVRQGKFNPETVGRQRRRKMTVREMFDHYLPLRVTVKNKGEDERYAAYWSELFGDFDLNELYPADLEEWQAKRLQEVKPSTVNRALEYLRAFYNRAVKDGHCKSNPVDKIELMEENNERHRYLLEGEEQRLRGGLPAADFDLVAFALATGLRQAEQFALAWEHVDVPNKVLKIPESKSGKHRFVRLNSDALAILERQRQLHDGESPWVFPGTRQPSIHRDAHNFVRRVFQEAVERVGIQDLTWHDLREDEKL